MTRTNIKTTIVNNDDYKSRFIKNDESWDTSVSLQIEDEFFDEDIVTIIGKGCGRVDSSK